MRSSTGEQEVIPTTALLGNCWSSHWEWCNATELLGKSQHPGQEAQAKDAWECRPGLQQDTAATAKHHSMGVSGLAAPESGRAGELQGDSAQQTCAGRRFVRKWQL